MNTRITHKNALKTIIERVVYNDVILPVFTQLKTTNDRFPYAFITSNDLTPNKDGGTLRDRGTYERVRVYSVVLVFKLHGESIDEVNAVEAQIDELEELVLDELSKEASRNDEACNDMYVTSISTPINGIELSLDSSLITKVFTVAVETQEEYA